MGLLKVFLLNLGLTKKKTQRRSKYLVSLKKYVQQKSIINRNLTCKSSNQRCSLGKGVLRNFPKFTRKHLCLSPFLNTFTGLRPAALFKKRLWHRCFPVNFVKFLRTPFLQNTSGQLLQHLTQTKPFHHFLSIDGCQFLFRIDIR